MEKKDLSEQEKQAQAFVQLSKKVQEALKELYSTISNPEFYSNKLTLMRFAIAQDYKVEETFAKWKSWVDWRLSYKPEEINENEECIQKQKEAGKLEWFGQDKDRRPCLYYKMKNHQNTK